MPCSSLVVHDDGDYDEENEHVFLIVAVAVAVNSFIKPK